ncbi:prohead [Vibrio phage F86]
MSLETMVAASREGKLADFEQQFTQEIGSRVAARIEDMKQELGRSIRADGEVPKED